MICKWCGEALRAGDRVCGRCRRDVSPMSDCGGFFDLVPQAARTGMEMPAAEAPVSPVRQENVPIPPQKPAGRQNNPVQNVITVLALVLAVVFLIQTISLKGRLAQAEQDIQRLKNQHDDCTEATQAVEGETDPIQPETLPGEDQNPVPEKEQALLTAVFAEGKAELVFREEDNARLKDDTVKVEIRDVLNNPVVWITMELHSGEDGSRELVAQVAPRSQQWQIQTATWKSAADADKGNSWLPSLGSFAEGFLGDKEETAQETDGEETACSKFVFPVDSEEPAEYVCTITGVDGDGEEIRIVLSGIMI